MVNHMDCPEAKKVVNGDNTMANQEQKRSPKTPINAATFHAISLAARQEHTVQDRWMLDGGSNVHIINDMTKANFEITQTVQKTIDVGDGHVTARAIGKCHLVVKDVDGNDLDIFLKDVNYVPNFHLNVISDSVLIKHGVFFRNDIDTTFRKLEDGTEQQLFKVIRLLGCPFLDIVTPPKPSADNPRTIAYAAQSTRQPLRDVKKTEKQWHESLGHVHREAIQHLENAVIGAIVKPDGEKAPRTNECDTCSRAKAHKIISRRAREPVDTPFGWIAMDVVYFQPAYNGDLYMVHAYDLATHMHFVWTTINRNQLTLKACFDDLHAFVRSIGRDIHCLSTDDDRAIGRDFITTLRSAKVIHKPTAPYTPEQDPAERPGGQIIVTARAMRIHANLPHSLWPEIVKAAAYILNRLPIAREDWLTPFQLATGRKPQVQHLKIYGCKAYPLNHKVVDSAKLEPRAHIGYLVGWDSTNIYRIWMPSQNRIIRTRDVFFNETMFYRPDDIDLGHVYPIDTIYSLHMQPADEHQQYDELFEALDPHNPISLEQAHSPAQLNTTPANLPDATLPEGVRDQGWRDQGVPHSQLLLLDRPYWPEHSIDLPPRLPFEEHSNERWSHLFPLHNMPTPSEDVIRQLTAESALTLPPDQLPVAPPDDPPQEPVLKIPNELIYPSEVPDPMQQPPNHVVVPLDVDLELGDLQDNEVTYGGKRRRIAYYAHAEHAKKALCFFTVMAAIEQEAKLMSNNKPYRRDLPPEPKYWTHVSKHKFKEQWLHAAKIEFDKLLSTGTITWVDDSAMRPDEVPLPVTWVLKYKFDSEGLLEKFKARLCARGDLQATEMDTYAATLAAKIFRLFCAIIAALDLETEQLDAVNAFLNATLPFRLFLQPPEEFRRKGKILKASKAIYGLKESPRLWYNDLIGTLEDLGLYSVEGCDCLYTDGRIYIFFYVDDFVLAYHRSETKHAATVKRQLLARYEIRELGELKWFLGIKLVRDRQKKLIRLSQESYIEKIADKFNIKLGSRTTSTPVPTDIDLTISPDHKATAEQITAYQARVGSINWTAIQTRPDVAKAVSTLSMALVNPTTNHLHAADHCIRYLLQTKHYALTYNAKDATTAAYLGHEFFGASDASFADDKLTRRSSEGWMYYFLGGPIDWKAARQTTVTKSSTEAELLALSHAGSEFIWWQRFFNQLGLTFKSKPVIYCDNLQTLRIVTKDGYRLDSKLRHVDIHQCWLRQEHETGNIRFKWIKSTDMPADGLTKLLPPQRHQKFVRQLSLDIGDQSDAKTTRDQSEATDIGGSEFDSEKE